MGKQHKKAINVEGDNHDCRLHVLLAIMLFCCCTVGYAEVTPSAEVSPSVVVTGSPKAVSPAATVTKSIKIEKIPEMEYDELVSIEKPYLTYKLSNQNFTYDSQSPLTKRYYTVNFNRFRGDIETGWANKFTFNTTLDLQNYLGRSYVDSPDFHAAKDVSYNMPLNPHHDIVSGNTDTLRSNLYRAYATVYLPGSNLVLGLQRIPFGVGRIWNPTDTLNPPNPISVEPGERIGVYGANYTLNVSDVSQASMFLTLNRDNETRDYGYRLLGNVGGFDTAASAIRNKDMVMSGFELDGELLDTGVGIRTEVAHFDDRRNPDLLAESTPEKYYRYVYGFDFAVAIPNTLYVVVEALINERGQDKRSDYDLGLWQASGLEHLAKHYVGILLNYELTPLTSVALSEIRNLDDGSYFVGPTIKWSLSDNSDLTLGGTFFCGYDYGEFTYFKDLYYLSYSTYF